MPLGASWAFSYFSLSTGQEDFKLPKMLLQVSKFRQVKRANIQRRQFLNENISLSPRLLAFTFALPFLFFIFFPYFFFMLEINLAHF